MGHAQSFALHSNVLMPVLFLLLTGAGTILLWGVFRIKVLPSWRLQLMQEGAYFAPRADEAQVTDWHRNTVVWYARGLSPEERWQIVRIFSKADISPSSSLAIFMVIRIVLAGGGAVLAYLASPASYLPLPIVLAVIAATAGWLLPVMTIAYKLKQHRRSVASALPNALELLAICVGAGLSLEAALQRVAKEIRLSSEALGDEFSLTWAEISISPSREQALLNLAGRVGLPAVKSVIGTLIQSLRYGTPLAQSLRNAANDMRNRQMIEMEERATGLPAMLTVPMMLFIMPAVFLIVGGPAAVRLMEAFK